MLSHVLCQCGIGERLGDQLLRSGDEERSWCRVNGSFAFQLDRRTSEDLGKKCIEPSGDPRRLHLEFDYEDPVRLQQVVTNLLSNAIKFTPKNGTVTMTLEDTADAVCIKVKDTGVGIARVFLPYVFEPFLQAESGAAQHSGLGLGLAIVRHLVELHKGTVHVESAGPGQGATFVLTLPIKDARDQDRGNGRGI